MESKAATLASTSRYWEASSLGFVVLALEIRFPLFVRAKDTGEIYKFLSIRELQLELEKIDVENEEYEAWDRNGVPVKLEVQPPVWLRLAHFAGNGPSNELINAVEEFANAVGVRLHDRPTIDTIEAVVDEIRAAHEKQMFKTSLVRRLIANFRRDKRKQ